MLKDVHVCVAYVTAGDNKKFTYRFLIAFVILYNNYGFYNWVI